MADRNMKVIFGKTSKGNPTVLHKQYEFVKHREYANGTIQWRCKHYQKAKCQARLTTNRDIIVSDGNPDHSHFADKKYPTTVAINEVNEKISDLSDTSVKDIKSAPVCTQLLPVVQKSLSKKLVHKKSLKRKFLHLDSASNSATLPSPQTNATSIMPVREEFTAGKKVAFGVTSRGNPSVIYNKYEFVKHREYANGTIQWRCAQYQKSRCRARLTINRDTIVRGHNLIHQHSTNNKKPVLFLVAASELKDAITQLNVSSASPMKQVQLPSDELVAPRQKPSNNTTVQRKHHYMKHTSNSLTPCSSLTEAISRIPAHDESMVDKKVKFGKTSKRKAIG